MKKILKRTFRTLKIIPIIDQFKSLLVFANYQLEFFNLNFIRIFEK